MLQVTADCESGSRQRRALALAVRFCGAFRLFSLVIFVLLGATRQGLSQEVDFNEKTSALSEGNPVVISTDEDGRHGPRLGIYDPRHQFATNPSFQIEHVFIPWQAFDKAALRETIAAAGRMRRDLMVTVEPYTLAPDWRTGSPQLFADISQGKFDEEIDNVCRELSAVKGTLYLRWGHEMEEPSRRYPWARKDADGYVAAYRYFVTRCRTQLPDAKFVWSPKGSKGIAAYFPGKAYVDAVGIALWGLQAYDKDVYGRAMSYREALRERYDAVAVYGMPVIVAEVGAAGSNAYRRSWFSQIFAPESYRDDFPQIAAVVYFNDKEPYYWPGGYGSPDWRLDSGDVSAIALSALGETEPTSGN